MRIYSLLAIFYFCSLWMNQTAQAQYNQGPTPVQFSGVVMANDSLSPVFFANVYVKGTTRGTVSNVQGYFSFVVEKGDTVVFSAVSYLPAQVIIPENLKDDNFSLIQFLKRDTIMLPEAVVYPWPTPLEFRRAFLAADPPNDNFRRAQRNLSQERLREVGEVLTMDGRENFAIQMRNYSDRLYYQGQIAPMRIFDPMAWVRFFKALKRGDFKNKRKKR